VLVPSVMPASAGGPADNPACLVGKVGGLKSIQGTVAVNVRNAVTMGATDVDVTMRMSAGKTPVFFRANVPNVQVNGTSNEGILCNLLDENQSPAASALRAAILAQFGFAPTARFVLGPKSVTNAEIQGAVGQWLCDGTYTDPTLLAGPCSVDDPPTMRGASMADVVLYVQ
jgi:hypothetical protein